jgi:hypothetical protein
MDLKKSISYTIVTLWLIASLLDIKDNYDAKNILMLIAGMALFIEAFI